MKKMSKNDVIRRDQLTEELADILGSIEDAIREMEPIFDTLNLLVDAYNMKVEEAQGFASDIVSEMEQYQSERSEKWHDGDAGQAYQAWHDDWNQVSFEELEHFAVPDVPEVDTGLMADLPTEPEG